MFLFILLCLYSKQTVSGQREGGGCTRKQSLAGRCESMPHAKNLMFVTLLDKVPVLRQHILFD